MMRQHILLILLFLLPLAAFADGISIGRAYPLVTETDQCAVISLRPGTATVDMYIGIDGIPKGETLTYILPFWHPVRGFRMEEMDGATFADTCVAPVHGRIQETVAIARRKPVENLAMAFDMVGFALAGPLTFIIFPPKLMGGRHMDAPSPYQTAATPHARAELYKLNDGDLQALLNTAGLPKSALAPLKKYHTPYFAVMRLTGTGDAAGKGVHYHFTHPLRGHGSYRYTYPLGTGAAWAKPIKLTQVYVSCPDAWRLDVTAPTVGESLSYYDAMQGYADHAHATATAFMYDDNHHITHPSDWAVTYLSSNPDRDIQVQMTPRPHGALFAFLRGMTRIDNGGFIVAFLAYLLAWLLATSIILYPAWVKADRPGAYWGHVGRLVAISLAIFGGLCAVFIASIGGGAAVITAMFAFTVLLYFAWVAYRKRREASGEDEGRDVLRRSGQATWLVALALYVLFGYLAQAGITWLIALIGL